MTTRDLSPSDDTCWFRKWTRFSIGQNTYICPVMELVALLWRKELQPWKAVRLLANGMFVPLPEFSIALILQAYAVIKGCPAKGKQLIERYCCCWRSIFPILIQFIVHFVSIRFFRLQFICSFDHSFDQLIRLRHFVYPVKLNFHYCIPAVHNFTWIYRASATLFRILSRADHSANGGS